MFFLNHNIRQHLTFAGERGQPQGTPEAATARGKCQKAKSMQRASSHPRGSPKRTEETTRPLRERPAETGHLHSSHQSHDCTGSRSAHSARRQVLSGTCFEGITFCS